MPQERQTVFLHDRALAGHFARSVMAPAPLRVWLASLPNLAGVTAAEIAEHGIAAQPVGGGLEIACSDGQLAMLAGALATAEQVLVRLGDASLGSEGDLARLGEKLCADGWLAGPQQARVAVHAKAATVAKAAWLHNAADRWAQGGDGSPTVHLTVGKTAVAVAVEPAGFALHQRGYRLDPGQAPLRETLAAAALRWAGHQPGMSVWDACCGSGTLAIEALLAGQNHTRRWAAPRIAAVQADAPNPQTAAGTARCGDLDPQAVARTLANAERAGVAGRMQCDARELGQWRADAPVDFAAANLPWGGRLATRAEARRLAERWAAVARRVAAGAKALVVIGEPQLAGALGLVGSEVLATRNGGRAVWLAKGTVPAGASR